MNRGTASHLGQSLTDHQFQGGCVRRNRWVGLLTIAALLTPASAWALPGGCVVSPENPSVILGLIGAAAAGAPFVLARLRQK